MALKFLVDSLEGLSEDVVALYEKTDAGKFQLKVDGAVSKSTLDEFRTNNIDLLKERKELQTTLATFGKNTPEEIAAMQARILEIDDKKMIDAGKIDELVDARVERMKADFEGQTTALSERAETAETENTILKGSLSSLIIDTGLQSALSAVGSVRKGAMTDLLRRGRAVYSLDENQKPVPTDGQGSTIFGKDGKSPITMDEWAQSQLQEASYLFEGSSGGGGGGGDDHGGPSITIETARSRAVDGDGSADLVSDLASGKVAVQ